MPQPKIHHAVKHFTGTRSPVRLLSCAPACALHASPYMCSAVPSGTRPRLKETSVPPFHRPVATRAVPECNDSLGDTLRPPSRAVPGPKQLTRGGQAPELLQPFKLRRSYLKTLTRSTQQQTSCKEDEERQALPGKIKRALPVTGNQPARQSRAAQPQPDRAVRPPLPSPKPLSAPRFSAGDGVPPHAPSEALWQMQSVTATGYSSTTRAAPPPRLGTPFPHAGAARSLTWSSGMPSSPLSGCSKVEPVVRCGAPGGSAMLHPHHRCRRPPATRPPARPAPLRVNQPPPRRAPPRRAGRRAAGGARLGGAGPGRRQRPGAGRAPRAGSREHSPSPGPHLPPPVAAGRS